MFDLLQYSLLLAVWVDPCAEHIVYLSIKAYLYLARNLEHGGAPERQRGEELEMREPERKRSLHLRQRGRLALKQRVSSGSFLRPTHKTGPDNKKTVTKRAT